MGEATPTYVYFLTLSPVVTDYNLYWHTSHTLGFLFKVSFFSPRDMLISIFNSPFFILSRVFMSCVNLITDSVLNGKRTTFRL